MRCASPFVLLTILSVCGPVDAEPPRVDRHGDPLPPGALARLGTTRLRPGEAGGAFAVSPDGKLLATGEPYRLRLWDLADGKELRSLELPRGVAVYEIQFSPDGKRLAVRVDHQWIVSRSPVPDESVFICDTDSGEVVRELPERYAHVAFGFVCGGKVFFAHQRWPYYRGDERPNAPVRLWDTSNWRQVDLLPAALACVSAPDGKILATGGFDGVIRLWDVSTRKELRALEGHGDGVRGVTFSSDGKLLASVGGSKTDNAPQDGAVDRSIRLWDVDTGKEVRRLALPKGHVRWLEFSPTGRTLLGQDETRTTILWETATGKILRSFPPADRWPNASWTVSAFSPDGRTLVLSTDNHDVRFLDADTGEERRRWADETDRISEFRFTPDGKMLLVNGDCLRFRDVATGEERYPFQGHRTTVRELTFTPDGRVVTSVAEGNELRTWTADGTPLPPSGDATVPRLFGHGITADGKCVVAFGMDGVVRVRDLASGREVRSFRVLPPPAAGVREMPEEYFRADPRRPFTGRGFAFGPGCRTMASWPRTAKSIFGMWPPAGASPSATPRTGRGRTWPSLRTGNRWSPKVTTRACTSGRLRPARNWPGWKATRNSGVGSPSPPMAGR
jgi:WD40 repeat protein